MRAIAIKEAITSGAWYQCRAASFGNAIEFRLRILRFERAEIDPSFLGPAGVEGMLWLLSIEVVNLTKAPIKGYVLLDSMRLMDGDGFQFQNVDANRGLQYVDELSGLRRLSGSAPLSPKIKVSGAVAFDLPDEENSYHVTFDNGSVNEA